MGEFSNYANARAGSIEAATDLYGACSTEVTATINAWAAVGVGDRAPAICAAEITGWSQFCAENGPSVFAEYRVQASPGALKDWSSSNGAFGFGQLGRVDFVTLYQIPSYADATTLSVYIQSPTNPAANTWRYYTINTIVCSSPPNCPPGQICEVQAQQVAQQAKTGSKTNNNITSQGISIYPNPATIAATLDLGEPATGPTMVSLKDMLGRTVYSHLVAPGLQTLPLALHNLPNGTFILSVTTTQGSTSQRLLINR